MATIKSYTDLSQSKVLNKILSDESADMRYDEYTSHIDGTPKVGYKKGITKCIPCWSLTALLSILPKIEYLKPFIDLSPKLDSDEVAIYYHSEDSPYIVKDNLVDACYEMIIKLDELKLL